MFQEVGVGSLNAVEEVHIMFLVWLRFRFDLLLRGIEVWIFHTGLFAERHRPDGVPGGRDRRGDDGEQDVSGNEAVTTFCSFCSDIVLLLTYPYSEGISITGMVGWKLVNGRNSRLEDFWGSSGAAEKVK